MFLGATDTVTGSKYLLTNNQQRILIDCGLFQGYTDLRLRNWSKLPIDPKSIHSEASAALKQHIESKFGWNCYLPKYLHQENL